MDEYVRSLLAGLADETLDQRTRRDRLAFARSKVRPEFLGAPHRQVFEVLCRYIELAGVAISPDILRGLLAGAPEVALDMREAMVETLQSVTGWTVGEAAFRVACLRLGEMWRVATFSTTLQQASEVLYGRIVADGKELAGYEDSIQLVRTGLETLETYGQGVLPEGDINREASAVLRAYERARVSGSGILTGYSRLDQVTNGMSPGELWMVIAYTSEGKSTFALNAAYNAVYEHGKHVLYVTVESTREQIRTQVVARHSRRFDRAPLTFNGIAWGRLTDPEQAFLREVVADLNNPRYGSLWVTQLPKRASVDTIAETLRTRSRVRPVDLLVVDYAGLLGTSTKRSSRREELDDIVVSLKRLATDSADGVGTPIITPWQVSRDAWQTAKEYGGYTKAALSETSQAEKSSDVIVSLFKKGSIIEAQVLKSRFGEADTMFELEADWPSFYMGDRSDLNNLLAAF